MPFDPTTARPAQGPGPLPGPTTPAPSAFDPTTARPVTGPSLRQVLTVTSEVAPDAAATAARLAQQYPAAPMSILQDLAAYQRQAQIDDTEQRLGAQPQLADALRRDPMTAAQAQDDGVPLSTLAEMVNSFKRGFASTRRGADASGVLEAVQVLQVIGRIERGELVTDIDLAKATPFASMFAGAGRTPENLARLRATYQQRLTENVQDYVNRTRELQAALPSPELKKFQEQTGFGDALGALGESPVRIALQIAAESIGGLLPALPFIAAGGIAGGPYGLALTVGGSSATLEYLNALPGIFQELGVDITDRAAVERAVRTPEFFEKNRQAMIKAGVIGTVDAATAGLAGVRLARGAVANTAAQVGAQATGGAAGEVLGSVASGQPVSASAVLSEAIGEIPTAVIDISTQIARSTMQRAGEVQEATDDAAKLQAALQAATESKLRERNPEQFRALMQELVQRADPQQGVPAQIYVDGQVLNQLAPEVRSLLPAQVQGQIQRAADIGDTVAIPVADVLTVAPGTPLEQVLVENARTDPNSMSQAEARVAGEQAQVYVQQEFQRVLRQVSDQEALRSSREAVKQTVLGQLNAAGRFRPGVNDVKADLAADYFAVMGARNGMTPEQFYQRYPLRVLGAPAGQQTGVLNAPGEQWVHGSLGPLEGALRPGKGTLGNGFYLTNTETQARVYPRMHAMRNNVENPDIRVTRMRVKPGLNILELDMLPASQVSAEKLREAGYDGVRYRNELNIFDPANVEVVTEPDAAAAAYEQSVSTRLPTAKKATENPLEEMLLIGLDAAKMDREAFEANMAIVRGYPNMRPAGRASADTLAERFIQHVVDNLLWLHDQVPADIRARSKLWYDGARAIVDRWAPKYGLTDAQVSATLAVLSPQKDWFMNVSLAERVLDTMINRRDFRWDQAMTDKVNEVLIKSEEEQKALAAEEGAVYEPVDPSRYYEAVKRIQGKTLGEVLESGDDRDAAIWIRVYDQAYNTRNYRIVSPEGDFLDWKRNNPTKAQRKRGEPGDMGRVAWGSFGEIGKAVSVVRDGSIANISNKLGGQHKVRNFYNNIFNPQSEHGDVTIDTHAVAAALLRPLAGGSDEVKHNFGSGGVSSSSVFGAKGTYGIYAEAYRRAAAERKILPREMQSITWEAVRGLFQAEQKKALQQTVNAVWRSYRKGEVTLDEARAETLRLANGIVNPDWVGTARGAGPAWASSYSEELAGTELPVRGGTDGRGAGRDARGAAGDAGVLAQGDLETWAEGAPLVARSQALTYPWTTGEPVVVEALHGTTAAADFQSFRPSYAEGQGSGIYFSTDPQDMEEFAGGQGGRVIPVQVKLLKPYVDGDAAPAGVQDADRFYDDVDYRNRELQRLGFDGVIAPQANNLQGVEVVVFRANTGQIRSAVAGTLMQGPRGTFNPATLELVLNPNADLTTFFHELGHFFLEVQADIASQPNAPAQIVEDMNQILAWFGVPDLATWNSYTLDQKRPYHERLAESFEQYVMEGKAPSVELQPVFRRIRAWFLSAYKSLKAFVAQRGAAPAGGETLGQGARAAAQARARALGLPATGGADQIARLVRVAESDPSTWTREDFDLIAPHLSVHQDLRPGAEARVDSILSEGLTKGMVDNVGDMASGQRWTWGKSLQGVPAYVFISGSLKYQGGGNPRLAPGNKPLFALRPSKGQGFYEALQTAQTARQTLGQGNQAKGPNIQLNDDIRRVFDRMLATDEQIAQANEVAGLMPDEQADGEAAERLQKRSIADLKWAVKARDKVIAKLKREAREIEKAIRAQVTAEVDQRPEVLAKAAIEKAEKEFEADPVSADMNIAAIADAFGYPSVEAMYRAIELFGDKREAIDGLVEQRMLEEHGDLIDERAIQQAANEAVHNEARARSLATELRTQQEMLSERADTGQVNARGARMTVNVLVEAAKQFAANVIARTPLKDLRATAWKHTAAERRAGKRWTEATMAGDTQAAVQAKQDQMLNNAAAKAALEAAAESKKILEFFARVTKGNDEKTVEKGRDPDIVNAARAVLAAYGVQSPASKGAAAYLEVLQKNDPDTFNAIAPMMAAATQNAQPLEALTFEELQGLHERIRAMWFLAKRSRQMEVDGNLLDIDDVAQELFARMEQIGIPDRIPGEGMAVTRAEERGLFLKQGIAFLRRVEQWAEGMDGKYGGPFLRFVFQPIKDAADRYRKNRIEYRKRFQALVDNLAPIVGDSVIEAPEFGYTFGTPGSTAGTAMNEILHAITHTGNESNKRKLLLGRGWAFENADGTLDTTAWDTFLRRLVNEGKLERAHFDFVQGVWDLLEDTKPLAQKAHRDAFGRFFSEVTADAFVDPFGVTRRGGYVPAQVDTRLVKDNALRKLAEEENNSMAFAFPQPAKGFTMARTEYNRPLMLDLRSLSQHLDKVLLFSHMTNPARDVRKLITRKTVSQPLDRLQPAAIESMLQPWLQRSAQQIVETPIVGTGKWARLPGLIRARAGMALMFANVSNAIQQITGLSTAAVRVKPSFLMRSVAQYVANPVKFSQAVWGASPYMDDRAKNEVAVLNEQMQAILLKPSTFERAQDFSMRHAYFLQTALDNVLSPIVWTGAFNQALADGMSDADAIRFADSTVRQTQGSTLPEDVSRLETGSAWARVFTQFVGYFNMMANTNATALKQVAGEVGLKKGAGRALYIVMMGFMVPIWVAEAIALAFRGGPEDEDEDGYLDDWLAEVFGMGTVKGLLAQIPIAGQFAVAGMQRFNDNPLDDRVSLSPAVSLLESSVGAPQSVYKAIVEDGSAQKAIRDVATLVSVATGVPVYGLARPIGYAAGVAQGRIEPEGPADLARGLITGTASPESKQR